MTSIQAEAERNRDVQSLNGMPLNRDAIIATLSAANHLEAYRLTSESWVGFVPFQVVGFGNDYTANEGDDVAPYVVELREEDRRSQGNPREYRMEITGRRAAGTWKTINGRQGIEISHHGDTWFIVPFQRMQSPVFPLFPSMETSEKVTTCTFAIRSTEGENPEDQTLAHLGQALLDADPRIRVAEVRVGYLTKDHAAKVFADGD
jgi:hypothetical protein